MEEERKRFYGWDIKPSEEKKEGKKEISKKGYTYLGVIFGLLSLLFFPIIFGIVSIFCGYRIFKRWDEKVGLGIMILGACCMILGLIIGAIIGSMYLS